LLFSIAMAFVPGYALFEALGLKGELGALVIGMLLASHPDSDGVSKSLLGLKDLLLVAFFLSLGLTADVTTDAVLTALLLVTLLPLKAAGFTALFSAQRVRNRTAVLGGLTLANYSEFALIVVASAVAQGTLDEEWSASIAIAVAISFIASAILNRQGARLVPVLSSALADREGRQLHPEDRPIEVGHAHAVVLGMGRVGLAAYDRLANTYDMEVVGVDSDRDRVQQLVNEGRNVVEADATDGDFWARLNQAEDVELAVLAMPFHGSNVLAIERLGESGFRGKVAALAKYDDDLHAARQRGADTVLQLYDGAGRELADQAVSVLRDGPGMGTQRP